MKNRKLEMAAMSDKGTTLEEIGKKFGLSRQRIHQIIGSVRVYQNRAENMAMEELASKGFTVVHSGFPDFFCFNEMTKESKFVEVKSGYDSLRKNQRFTIGLLRKAGFLVEIVNINRKDVDPEMSKLASALGSVGGKATFKKLGKQGMTELSKLGVDARNKKKQEDAERKPVVE